MVARKTPFGIKPFVFRDEFEYFIYGAMAFGRGFTFDKFWESGLSELKKSTLTSDETEHCTRQFGLGWKCWMKINELFYSDMGSDVPRETAYRLVMSRTDLLTVVALCKYQDEMWNPLYHGHQAAEKALKAFLFSRGYSDGKLKGLGHDLGSVLKDCCTLAPVFEGYRALLPHMKWQNQWRYEPLNIPKQHVINMYDGALQMLAQVVDIVLRENPSDSIFRPSSL